MVLPLTGRAHRLDEYLQATLVTIEPAEIKLQINLTPGIDIAEQVLTLIDRDHNGVISSNEAALYSEKLNQDIIVRLDQRKLSLKLSAFNFPALSDLRTGWGIVQLELTATIGRLAPGRHKLTMNNRHLPNLSVYLFNAARPASESIQITRQKRNQNQNKGEIEFTIAQSSAQHGR